MLQSPSNVSPGSASVVDSYGGYDITPCRRCRRPSENVSTDGDDDEEDIYVPSSRSLTSMELQTYDDCDALYYNLLSSLHLDSVDKHRGRHLLSIYPPSPCGSMENLSAGSASGSSSGSASLLRCGSAPPSPGSDTGSHFSWDIESYAELPIVLQTFRMAQQQQQQLEERQQRQQQQQEQEAVFRRQQEETESRYVFIAHKLPTKCTRLRNSVILRYSYPLNFFT